MKTKLLLSLILSLNFCLLSSQIPQGFNYQAIARDGSGNPILNATIMVKLSILSDTTGFYASGGGTYVWEEEQTNVKTNAFGLFTVVFGNPLAVKKQGTAASFSAIDWAKMPLYIGTKIANPTSYKNMGSAKLWSVPYSMVTDSTKALLKGSKLSVVSSNDLSTDALFEVKRKDGQTVFAVYPDAVNIYVPRTAKGTKGGFAIGGFEGAKLGPQDYFRVTPDSVRIYIDKTPKLLKGATKGGFAIGGFDQAKNTTPQDLFTVSNDSVRIYLDANPVPGKGATKGGFAIGGFDQVKGAPPVNYLNVATEASGIINPSQNRILWYPIKNAFLTGRVLVEKPDSVGQNSFATGYESKAKGNYSQALGYQAIARGMYSTSIGQNSISNGDNSFAFGNGSKALSFGSYALGTGAKATGNLSFALGSVGVDSTNKYTSATVASGYGAFALGFGSVASGQGAFAVGVSDTASGPFSLALGYQTSAKGWFATAMGFQTKASAPFSTAMGWSPLVEDAGWNGLATGVSTKAGNWAAAAFGDRTYASGHTSFATGYKTIASGHLSSTFGDQTTAIGDGAIAIGHNTTAQAYGSLVLGSYNVISGTPGTWYSWEPVFVIGNGTSATSRSNAMTVYKSGVADFGGYVNLNRNSTNGALYVNSDEALWYNGVYFSWGYGANYNYFANRVTIGNAANPSYMLYVNGSAWSTGSWGGSDVRWKKNLQPLGSIIPGILELNGYRFSWRKDEFPDMKFDAGPQIGLIAQDVEKIFPELVKTDNNGYKAVSYEKLSVLLLEGIKEQQQQIESAKKENIQLRSELQSIKEKMNQIEAIMVKSGVK